MEAQLKKFAEYLEKWSYLPLADRLDELVQWYRGNMPLPHPDWGPSSTIHRSLLWTMDAPHVRSIMGQTLSVGVSQMATRESWTSIEQDALREMLFSAAELGPSAQLSHAVAPLLNHCAVASVPGLAHGLRHALIFNQTDDTWENLWLQLLRNESYGCLSPAPLSDIRGLVRVGRIDGPDWNAIAAGVGHFSALVGNHLERRSIMHKIWQDLGASWNKDITDGAWNHSWILQGAEAGWPAWIFETMPSLWGRVPRQSDVYFIWTTLAEAVSEWFSSSRPLRGAPISYVRWEDVEPPRQAARTMLIRRIERARRLYSHHSSKGLEGIVIDAAAGFDEPWVETYQFSFFRSVPSHEERLQATKRVLCAAR